MIVGRLLGWLLIALALAALGREIAVLVETGAYRPIFAGELWQRHDPDGLAAAEAMVRHRLHPALWDRGIAAILMLPVWTVLGVPGVLLAHLFRRRPPADFEGTPP